ncbi:hypothetical protein [Longimicrobium sp.]|uniref:hypothetical protein n=1 Tax=Longimicrobium sp. TaxID=2029185 RepID=UPI002E37CCDB|nr:hypothetical protein [Longimicrobium sp.]HEX6042318.1 hypothetical protein [Longimicrobium sp.]
MPEPRTRSRLTRRPYDLALATATIAILGCTAVLALRSSSDDPFANGFGAGDRVTVFLQERDCTSNLAFLQLLARAEFSSTTPAVVYDVGGSESANRLAARFRGQNLPFRTRAAPRGALSRLRQMGYQATPVLVLLDDESRVRLVAAAPRTQDEMRTLASTLRVLTRGARTGGE